MIKRYKVNCVYTVFDKDGNNIGEEYLNKYFPIVKEEALNALVDEHMSARIRKKYPEGATYKVKKGYEVPEGKKFRCNEKRMTSLPEKRSKRKKASRKQKKLF